jgi:hypothetical protein
MPCGLALEAGWVPVRRTVDLDDKVNVGDHIEVAVRLLPILDEGTLDGMVRESLEKHGWTRQPDGSMTRQFGDVVATLPPGSSTIRLEVERSSEIKASATESGAVKEEEAEGPNAVEEKARKKAEQQLQRAREAAERAHVKKNNEALEAAAEELRGQLEQVVNEVTRGALEQRASSLGQIESINEGRDADGRYEVSIVVKT